MNKHFHLIAFTILVIININFLNAQTYESKNYLKIPANREIIKTIKVKNCLEILEAGTVVKYETKYKKGTIEYTVSKTDSLECRKAYPFDKEIRVKLKSLPGKANLTVDEKDPSSFQVNYWLSKEEVLRKGTTIHLLERKLGCDSIMDTLKVTKTLLKSDTSIYLARVYLCDKLIKNLLEKLKLKKQDTVCYSDTLNDWFKYSDIILKTYDGEKQTGVYANMYDRNGQYTLKLQNREFISYPKGAFEFGALTIPFKYRFGYTKSMEGTDIKVKDEFIADLNLGAYGGYQIGKHRFRMEGNKLRELARLGGSLGGFVNFSTAVLDSLNTTAGKKPISKDEKSTIGIFSPGFAAMFTLYNFQIGAFAGWDIAIGQDRNNWNYNERFWLGFGLGYTLSGFWKK